MKIYDSAVPYLTASNAGAVLTLQPNAMGTAVLDKAVTPGNAHIVASPGTAGFNNQPLGKLSWAGPYGFAPLALTLAGVVAGDTLVIDGVTYTAVASGATGTQFNVGGTDALTAANLVAAINAKYLYAVGPAFPLHVMNMMFQASLLGSGNVAGNCDIQGSLDGTEWVSVGVNPLFTFASAAAPQTAVSAVIAGYPLLRAVPVPASFSGTGVRLQVYMNEVRSY